MIAERSPPDDPWPEVDPLDLIARDHARHRQFCAELERLARAVIPDRHLARALLLHLRTDPALRVADAVAGLFPLLRGRAAPEDDIGPLLDRLEADHEAATLQRRAVLALLWRIGLGYLPGKDRRAMMLDFAERERRHLIVETAIVLPLARARLTRTDRIALHQCMSGRRGFLPEGFADTAGD